MSIKRGLIYLIITLLIIPIAFSVGITFTGELQSFFEPNKILIVPFDVLNNAGREMYIELKLGGDLAHYASLEFDKVFLKPGESKSVPITIKLPEKLEKPGKNAIILSAILVPQLAPL